MKSDRDVSVVLCGQAPMGIRTVEQLVSQMFRLAGLYVVAIKEYMSRARGGMNSTTIIVSSQPDLADKP